ncbi:MAG: glycosyltransferase family A protein [Patescibacteria group bacterium]|jgi:glycosyltransferase involved in cell wall biosynthesis|nr:glycosyltransferase family A protein [Patescibacteria group bacterium]
MISIIIPVYNQADKIEETLKSIELQTYRDYEVIVVNDGSTDKVDRVFGKFAKNSKDENNYYFINQENKGAPAARNRGVKRAKGDYLFFCDADATLASDALLLMHKALEKNKEAAYAYSSFYWGKKFFKVGKIDEKKLKKAPCIHTMSLIKREDFPENGWDESIKKLQDWDLWLTILEEKEKLGVFIEKPLFKVSPGGTISSWLPSFVYKLLPFLPKVKKYNKAVKIIKDKHGLYFKD